MNGIEATAAALLLLMPLCARGSLVTRVTPEGDFQEFSDVPEILRDIPVADPCLDADKAVVALESSIVDTQAQVWAYLMRQPGFAVRRLARKPGEEILHGRVRRYFYKRLAEWDEMEVVPPPSADALREINDVATRIRLVRDVCPATPSAAVS